MRVIGLMSGTSMDAIDAAVVDIERQPDHPSPALRAFVTLPYPDAVRRELALLLQGPKAGSAVSVSAISSLDVAIGEAFAEAAQLARVEAGGEADLIGSHGQTVAHEPHPDAASARHPSTSQLGEAAVIAARTGLTTVADFRVADVAAGGQGAPLVSYVDHLVLSSPSESRVALNIGGIANVTLLPADGGSETVRAFDTGPGNMPIDEAVRMLFPDGPGYDRNGQIAARATANVALLQWLLADPFFARRPPKTAGWEQFGPGFVSRAWAQAQGLSCDRECFVATLTALTARTIAKSVPADVRRVIVSGGGVHNRTLMRALELEVRSCAPEATLVTSEAFGMPPDAKEAIAFAVLAFEALHGRHNNLPSATGAARPAVLGKIVPGANFGTLMHTVWRA